MNGIENIHHYEGFNMALSGMLIVFVSLVLISLFIAVLPRLLEPIHHFLPESDHPDELAKAPAPKKQAVNGTPLQEAAAAAVAYHAAQGGE